MFRLALRRYDLWLRQARATTPRLSLAASPSPRALSSTTAPNRDQSASLLAHVKCAATCYVPARSLAKKSKNKNRKVNDQDDKDKDEDESSSESEDEDSDKEDEEESSEKGERQDAADKKVTDEIAALKLQPPGYKVIIKHIAALRYDSVLSSGLGLSRNKIDEAFYSGRARLNGDKIAKKSAQVKDMDYLELIGDVNDKTKVRDLKRVILYKVLEKKDKKTPKVALIIWKAGLTEADLTKKTGSFKKFA